MRFTSLSILVVSVLMVSCDEFKSPETRIREKIWAEYKEKLKSPSSAKLISSELTESTKEDDKLKYYLKSKYALQDLDRHMDLAKSGFDINNHETLHSTAIFDSEVYSVPL